jgi:hypothetical protein
MNACVSSSSSVTRKLSKKQPKYLPRLLKITENSFWETIFYEEFTYNVQQFCPGEGTNFCQIMFHT